MSNAMINTNAEPVLLVLVTFQFKAKSQLHNITLNYIA